MMLRSLTKQEGVKLMIAWYLTDDVKNGNNQADGNKREYLKSSKGNLFYEADSELWLWLQENHKRKCLKAIEEDILILYDSTTFFDKQLKEGKERKNGLIT